MDAPESEKDALQPEAGQSSETEVQEPSTPTQTYTEDQVRQRHSKLDKQISQLEKRLEASKSKDAEIGELRDQMAQMRKEKEEAELASASDDPDALKALREKQARERKEAELKQKLADLNARETAIKGREEKVGDLEKRELANEIAAKHNVSVAQLIKFTDGSLDAMEELARELPKQGEPEPKFKPDSGITTGGGGKTYKESEILPSLDPSTMTPSQIHERVLELEKAIKEGRLKGE